MATVLWVLTTLVICERCLTKASREKKQMEALSMEPPPPCIVVGSVLDLSHGSTPSRSSLKPTRPRLS